MRSIESLVDLRGRVGIITGGAGHIALAAAEALAEKGANLILMDVDAQGLEKRKIELEDRFKVEVEIIVCDFEKQEELQSSYDSIRGRHNKIDFIINNAAFVGTTKLSGWGTEFELQSQETWERCINVNMTVPFFIVQAMTPLLKKSDHASVINIGSIYGILGPDYSLYADTTMGNAGAYAASKGGLMQLTRWLSTTLAPDVRINSLVLGGIYRGQDSQFVKRYEAKTPLGRMGSEEDIKGGILFFISDLSAYITGQALAIDGGWSAW